MRRSNPAQYILVGENQVALPEGVSAPEWSLEKMRVQNPCIRAFLGCIKLLDGVLDSNYAILHCSPERLVEIWSKVEKVAELLRRQIAPMLGEPSVIPALDVARRNARLSLGMLSNMVLSELDRYPSLVDTEDLMPVRKLLCVSMGKVHAFLQDTFAELMACDPRGLHDADYFLSRRFPQDIEDSEWLYATVDRLHAYLKGLGRARLGQLAAAAETMRRDGSLPAGSLWADVELLLADLGDELTPLIREIVALRGIRFDELESLDRHSFEIPARCRMIRELYHAAAEVTAQIMERAGKTRDLEASIHDLTASHKVLAERVAELLTELDSSIQDLMAFVPLWLENIEMRRALLLKKSPDRLTN